jgi:voltage-gated potassium channel
MASRGIAIFGYYRSAVEVAAYLKAREHRIIIIDDNSENLEKARRAGFETAELDYRDDAELEKLGLGNRIDTLFCLFPDDAENVFLTISARALAPDVRIFAVAHDSRSAPNLRAAGADKVIETEAITGHRIWDIMNRPLVTAIMDRTLFGQADLNIAEIPVPASSFLDGVRVGDLDVEARYDLVLIGLVDRDFNEYFIHGKGVDEIRLGQGVILLVIGPAEVIERLKRDLEAR